MPAGSVTDLAGNENDLATEGWIFDTTAPEITFNAGSSNLPLAEVGISFNEVVEGLALDDFVVTNGSAANLVEITPGLEYTLEVTAAAAGEVNLELPAGSVADLAGNENVIASASWLYDMTSPSATVDAGISGATNAETIAVTITFDEAIEGLSLGDLVVTNGTAANLSEITAGTEFTIDITATDEGPITVELPAGAVADEAGNENEAASDSWIYDSTPPAVTLDAGLTEPTTEAVITVSVSISEVATGLTLSDFDVTNGAASNLVEISAGEEYTVDITAADGGEVTVELPSDALSDMAGNGNEQTSVSYVYDDGTGIPELPEDFVRLFPNPASDHITIDLANAANVKITHLNGKIILAKENVMKETFILSGFAKGIYLIRVETDRGLTIRKFVIE